MITNPYFWGEFNLNPDYALGIVGQQKYTIKSSAHRLFWIERVASYFEIKNWEVFNRF